MRSTIIAVMLMSMSCSSDGGVEDVGELCDELALTFCDAAKGCGLLVPGEDETEAEIRNSCLISGRNICSRELSSLDELANPGTCTSVLKNNSCTEIQDGLADHIRSCERSVLPVDGGSDGPILVGDASENRDSWCLEFGTAYCRTIDICPGIMPTPDCGYNVYLQCLSNGAPNNEQFCDSGIRDWERLCPILDGGGQWPAACW